MTIAIVILMLLGYVLICTEHITHINKAVLFSHFLYFSEQCFFTDVCLGGPILY